MATLTIGNQKVQVSDDFLKLSPDEQHKTVDEIAAKLGGQSAAPAQSGPPAGAVPGSREYADWAAQAARAGQTLPQVSGPEPTGPAPEAPNLMNSTMATVNGIVGAVPGLQPLTDVIGGGVAQMTGGNFDQYMAHQRQVREQAAQAAPLARLSGDLGGMLAGYGGLSKLPGMAASLGFEGKLGTRMLNSGLSSLGIGTAQSMSAGEKPAAAMQDNVVPSLISAALPGAGALAKYAAKGMNDSVVRPIATAFNRENEVTRRLGTVIAQDKGIGNVMTQADEAAAKAAGVPVMNADRFGQATRTMARTAANISPEADGLFKRTVEDRFSSQGPRAISFVKQLMGGATDDLALHDALRAGADKANGLAYGKAYSSPAARAVWTPEIKDLMQSDTFRAAISAAESRGTDKAAIAGVKAVRNPFEFRADGTVTLKVNKDGSRALPSLQFWDQVKRNLDSAIDKAKPTPLGGGDRALYADLTAMKQKLVGSLDAAVPDYKAARQGAAAFFGADDAIEAGKKGAESTKGNPEIERALSKFKPAERDAAAVGYTSQIIDKIKASGDRRNVIQQLFGSESARERNRLFLGPAKAAQLEAYVRVEGIVDQLRGAVTGNSTTAKQLIAAGVIGGAGGYFSSGGNVQTGMTWAALAGLGRRGAQVLGKRVDEQVMKSIAEILVSQDPAKLTRAIHNASMSKAHMEALDAIMQGLAIVSRAGVAGGASYAAAVGQ